jgi:hypothetical protein
MGFALMWVEALAAALLFSATAMSLGAPKESWTRLRNGSLCFGGLICLGICGLGICIVTRETLKWDRDSAFLLAVGLCAVPLLSTGMLYFFRAKRGDRFNFIGRASTKIIAITPSVLLALATTLLFNPTYNNILFKWVYYLGAMCIAAAIGTVLLGFSRLIKTDGATPTWPASRLAVCTVTALMLLLITFWNLDSAAKASLNAARIESGALALSIAPARVPDQENAALIYQRAFEAFKRDSGQPHSNVYGTDIPLNDPQFKKHLAINQTALALYRRASALPGCHFDRDYTNAGTLSLTELAGLRDGSRLLAASARSRAAEGNVGGALEDIRAIRSILRHSSPEPMIISLLVNIAINAIGAGALEQVLTTSVPTIQDLTVLPVDDTFTFRAVLQRSLRGEEAFGMGAFAALANGDEVGDGLLPGGKFEHNADAVFRVFMFEDELTTYRQMMRECKKLAAAPYHQSRGKWEVFEDEIRKKSGFLTGLMAGTLARTMYSATHGEATYRLSNLALSVAGFRAANGKYPETVAELVPTFISSIPIDPFDGLPLRMAKKDSQIVLYSVGKDAKDGGGSAPPANDFYAGDIIFRVGIPVPK